MYGRCFISLASTTVFEVRNGGSDANGGGYKSDAGTTDYSQQDAAQLTVADGATAGIGNTTLTSATGGFTAAMVGSITHLYTGTNLTDGWYEITARTNTNTVTLDRAPDDGVGGVSAADVKVGGALATYGGLGQCIEEHKTVSGMKAFIKYHSTPYSITSSSNNVTGGALALTSTDQMMFISGYDSTRTIGNDDANRPTVRLNGGTPVAMYSSANEHDQKTQLLCDVLFDLNGTDVTGDHVVALASTTWNESVCYCVYVDCDSQANNGFYRGVSLQCKVENALTVGFKEVTASHCYAYNCNQGFELVARNIGAMNCVASSCVIGFDGGTCAANCIAYNGTTGFRSDSSDSTRYVNCVATNNSGYGFSVAAGSMLLMFNCATGDNTSGRDDGAAVDIGAVSLPAAGTYFTNAAAGDFRPASGDGDLLMAAGIYPPSSANNATLDIGAVQHADPAGGGGGLLTHPGMGGGARG